MNLTDYVLNDIISVLVDDEFLEVDEEGLQDGLLLLGGAVLQHSLNHSTTIGVRRQQEDLEILCEFTNQPGTTCVPCRNHPP